MGSWQMAQTGFWLPLLLLPGGAAALAALPFLVLLPGPAAAALGARTST